VNDSGAAEGLAELNRRRFLALAAACATTLWLPRSAWCQPRFGSDPFTLGVASGSPTHDSVVLWTRLAPEAIARASAGGVTVRWEMADDPAFTRIFRKGQANASPALGYSVHVEVGGLDSDRWYFYRFITGDAQSAVGRTRTFPAPEAAASRLRVAYASCQRWEHGFFSAYRHMRDDDPDVVLFLGDYIYEYPNAKNAVRVPTGGWVRTLDDFRVRYALHKSDPDLRAMHMACPWLVTWDDHEVQNDYAGAIAGDSGAPVADFAALRAAAYQAYYEHMPLRASSLTRALAGLAQGAELRIHSTVRFGALASFYLLDDRQYRTPHVCTRDGRAGSSTIDPAQCPDWTDPRRSLLGASQERWLDDAFAHGSAGWNVLGQQTLFGQRDFRSGSGQSFWNDGWDGYPAARARMIASMRRNALANPVFLGGDIHQNWVGHVKADYADPKSATIGVEFCGTSISARSDGSQVKAQLAKNPHFIFADAERRGYGLAEFTPKRLTTSLRAVNDVTVRETGIGTLARFTVEAGRSAIVAE
jgi:alkaline phosphatase D